MAELSEKLGLGTSKFLGTRLRHIKDAVEFYGRDYEGPGWPEAIEEDRRATVEAVARWLEEQCNSPKRAQDIRRELLSRPEPEGGRGENGTPQRCPSINQDRLRCGLKAGHSGRHTALMESGSPWAKAEAGKDSDGQ